ncbi:MAG: hypothetical protein ACE5JA_05465, partial [bacterium]
MPPSAECTLFVSIPYHACSGDYSLEVSAADSLMRTSRLWQRQILIEGILCALDSWTGYGAYTSGDSIDVHSGLANGSIGFLATVHNSIADDRSSVELLAIDAADSMNKRVGCKVYEGSAEISPHSAWFETSFTFNNGPSVPSYIAVDRNGLIYASDYFHCRVFRLTPEGRIIKKWGKCGYRDGEFKGIWGITVDDSGYVYATDFHNFRIQKFSTDGQFITKWDLAGAPWDICVDDSGYVYVVDYTNSKIEKFTSSGVSVLGWGSEGAGEGQFNRPWGIGTDGTLIYVADTYNHRIQVFTSNGKFLRKWGNYGYGEGELVYPSDVAVSPEGFVYTGEYGPRVNKFTKDGEFVSSFVPHGEYPPSWSIALSSESTLLSCGYDYLIHRYSIGLKGALITEPVTIVDGERALAFVPSQHLNNGTISHLYDLGAGWKPTRYLTKENLKETAISFKTILGRTSQTAPSPEFRGLSLIYTTGSPDSLFWKDSVDVNVAADTTVALDTTAYIDVPPGKLYLNARLSNSVAQTVAASAHPFHILSGNLLLSLFTPKSAYRPNEEIALTVALGNSSDHEIEDIRFCLRTSNDTLLIESLSLTPSQWDTLIITTSAESSFAVFASAISTLGDSATAAEHVEVTAPSVVMEIGAPRFASHQPLDATFRLTNAGPHTLHLDVEGTIQDSVLFSEPTVLEPYTSRETTCRLQLAEAESIRMAIEGDIDTCISRLVCFGEGGNLVPRLQKEYDPSHQKVSFEVFNTGVFDLEYLGTIILRDSLNSFLATDTLTGFIPHGEHQIQDLAYNLPGGTYGLEYRLLCSCGNELESGEATLTVGTPYSARIESLLICADNSLPCGTITIEDHIRNTGTRELTGRVSVTCPFYHATKEIGLRPGETKSCLFSTQSLPPEGHYTFISSLERLGQVLDTLRSDFDLAPSYTLDAPDTLFCQIGKLATCPVSVTNTGSAIGTDAARFDFPSVLEDSHFISIDPCSTQCDSFAFFVPPDFEAGSYAGLLSVGDTQRDIVFQVRGLQLNVLAQFDKEIYSGSDTALLGLHVENLTEITLCLDVRISSGDFHIEDSCTIEGLDTASLPFPIPVAEADDRVFYGFYLQNGRAIHLGALYLHTREETAYVYTESQVYESGDSARAIVEAEIAGAIFSKIFGEYTPQDSLTVSPPGTTFSFLIPEEIASGTYSIDYTFTSSNKPEVRITGHHLFDVIGYTVRILRSTLDRMKYRIGDTLKATHMIRSNRGFRALLQAWIRDSGGDYATCYKKYLTLREGQNRLEAEGIVEAEKHGPAALLYGVFRPKPGNEYALLLAAGMSGMYLEPLDTIPPEFVWFSASPDTFNPLKGEFTRLNLMLSESCSV